MKNVYWPLAIGSLFLLVGCFEAKMEKVDPDQFRQDRIAYFQDSRTNLCFGIVSYSKIATNGYASYGMSITNVPCSIEVMKLVQR